MHSAVSWNCILQEYLSAEGFLAVVHANFVVYLFPKSSLQAREQTFCTVANWSLTHMLEPVLLLQDSTSTQLTVRGGRMV